MLVSLFLLKLAASLNMIIFGIHQFVHPEKWYDYLPLWAKTGESAHPRRIVRTNALGNLLIALFLVSGIWPIVAAWAVFLWFLALLPFAFMHDWKLGMRDLTVTICFLALVYLIP